MSTATPAKLRDGSWGARVTGTVKTGDSVTITTKAGKSWTATVSRVVWTGDGITLCATASAPRQSSGDSYGNPIGDGSSYRTGVTAPRGKVCPNCGSRECARAWDSRDLCDED